MAILRRIAVVLFSTAALGSACACADWRHGITDFHESHLPSRQEWQFELQRVSDSQQVRLSLKARINLRKLAGSNYWMRIAINDHELVATDLLNKRPVFMFRGNVDLSWCIGGKWRLVHAPDFAITPAQKQGYYADTDPFCFVWDITAHIVPGRNTLRIEHLPAWADPATMVLRDVEVVVGDPIAPPAPPPVAEAPTGPLPVIVARVPPAIPMQVALAKSGRIELAVAGGDFEVETRTSLPEGRWYATGDDPATILVARGESKATSWQTATYRVERRVTVHSDHAHIADTITNCSEQLIGVTLEHRLIGRAPPTSVYLAGRDVPKASASVRNSFHPSAFAQWPEMGIGLVAEDDIFRVHVRAFRERHAIGLGDDQLGIDPGESHTLEWSVYPQLRGDYWDFVNAVRRNWGANYTIPGPFIFAYHFENNKPAAWYADWVRRRGVRILATDLPRFLDRKPAHGTGISYARQWIESQAGWIRKLTSVAPDVRALVYFHAQLSAEPRAADKYADARLLTATGEHAPYPSKNAEPLFVPTRENSYGEALWQYVRLALDTIPSQGLYWDQMAYSIHDYAYDAKWDGCTVVIDGSHAVVGRRSSVPILMQPLKLAIIDYVRSREGLLIANMQPVTRTMLQQQIVRFVETGSYSNVINTHLACPLGLGNHNYEQSQVEAATNALHILEHGGVYYGYRYRRDPPEWDFVSVMYPITPVEIRSRVVLGEERILTARSGCFGWPDGAAADVFVVNPAGERVQQPLVREVRRDGKRLYEIRMPGDHFAILVKRTDS